MTNECPVCGTDEPTQSITINNSRSQYWSENSNGITESDVTFDAPFPGGDDVTSVYICEGCHSSNKYLTDEYVAKEL
jgi:hypothetical protein